VAEAFIILAKVSKILKGDIQRKKGELKVEKQKIEMKIANYYSIALEIASSVNLPSMIKRVASEMFNHLLPYFAMAQKPHLLF